MLRQILETYAWAWIFLSGIYISLLITNRTIRNFSIKVVLAVLVFVLTQIRDILSWVIKLLTRPQKPPESPRPFRQPARLYPKNVPKNENPPNDTGVNMDTIGKVMLDDENKIEEWFARNPDLRAANGR